MSVCWHTCGESSGPAPAADQAPGAFGRAVDRARSVRPCDTGVNVLALLKHHVDEARDGVGGLLSSRGAKRHMDGSDDPGMSSQRREDAILGVRTHLRGGRFVSDDLNLHEFHGGARRLGRSAVSGGRVRNAAHRRMRQAAGHRDTAPPGTAGVDLAYPAERRRRAVPFQIETDRFVLQPPPAPPPAMPPI